MLRTMGGHIACRRARRLLRHGSSIYSQSLTTVSQLQFIVIDDTECSSGDPNSPNIASHNVVRNHMWGRHTLTSTAGAGSPYRS